MARRLELEDLLDEQLASLYEILRRENGRLLDNLLRAVGSLKTTPKGRIKPTVENLKKIREIRRYFESVFRNPEYQDEIKKIKPAFDKISGAVDAYFVKTFKLDKDYPSKEIFSFLKNEAIGNVVANLESRELGKIFAQPIENLLKTNVTTGGTIDQLTAELRKSLGSTAATNQVFLQRYLGQIANDAVNEFSRSYINAYAEDLGLEWYLYEGKPISSSREFCTKRANKIYHRSEIEKWPQEKWNGKIPQTNSVTIFYFAGGYNCRHYLIPIPETEVPDSVKARVGA